MVYARTDVMDIDTALGMLDTGESGVLAGGTDYYPGLNDSTPDPGLLRVSRIAGLDRIECSDGQWRLGAAVTWTDLINAELPQGFNCLKQAGREVGSIQIQNTASIVGNICNASPAADGVPALLVLGAQVELSSVDGVRVLALQEFITGVRQTQRRSNELVTALLIPEHNVSGASEFAKLGSRTYLVISIVMCASRMSVDENNTISGVAIAVGACSPVARRLPELENALLGRTCTTADLSGCVTAEHVTSLSPISDVRASADYRLHAARVLLQRQVLLLAERNAAESRSGSV